MQSCFFDRVNASHLISFPVPGSPGPVRDAGRTCSIKTRCQGLSCPRISPGFAVVWTLTYSRLIRYNRGRSRRASPRRTLTDLGAEALVPQSRPALIRLTVETLARRHIFLLSVILVLLRFLLKLFAAPLNVLAGALDCIAAGKPGQHDVGHNKH